LEDGEMAELTAEGARIETIAGEKVERAPKRIDWSPVMAERGGYKHFMLKEIHEQPRALEDTLRGRVDLKAGEVVAAEMGLSPEVARAAQRVYLIACGTSHYAPLAAPLLLAVLLGRCGGTLPADRARAVLQALVEPSSNMREVLGEAHRVLAIARRYHASRDMLFLGRGLGYPIALEGALKLKEIAYVHAEGYAAGEMKHGPIALIDESMPVVVIAVRDSHYEKTLSNVEEVRARDGQVIAIATEGDHEIERVAQYLVRIPKVDEC